MLNRLAGILLLTGFACIVILPLLLVVFTAFKTTPEFYRNPIGLPAAWSLEHLVALFKEQPMWRYFGNSLIVTAATVLLELLLAGMIAYGIIRLGGRGSRLLFALFAAGLMVPSQVNMIPIYQFVRSLGLMNSLSGLVVVSVSVLLPLSVFMLSGFMRTLPKEILEAGEIDGAGEWRLMLQIALPLSAPYLAAVSAFLFIIVWNDMLFPMLMLTGKENMTLPIALLQFRGEYVTDYPMLLTGVMVASLPVIILFVLLQRYFIAGTLAGALKG
ncbi:carbohydrate ABC transporter permease [Paenibacillus sambharensis]|uniref:Carbohydrate ABC transporter permease n=1 Tax=Paenibacillus sambharensis TaxID=1803190 RepID=A0A2W1L6P8_9BACL|nr:carbohydrate ABC transporter permease [Paenibacillus sambharensis]PZD95878.1 carbohydrate ABC transporter permease [Paenibacillus sambharensis]